MTAFTNYYVRYRPVAALEFDLCLNLLVRTLSSNWKNSLRFRRSGWDGFGSISMTTAGSGLNRCSGCTDIGRAR